MTETDNNKGIRIITEPKVYVVGHLKVTEDLLRYFREEGVDPHAFWDNTCSDAERLAECAGRTCYQSFEKPRPGGNRTYFRHILEARHGNLLEHATFNILFTGISRSLSHELIRHRAGWSFSELSQRFVDLSDVAFVLPPADGRGYRLSQEHDGIPAGASNADASAVLAYLDWETSCVRSLVAYHKRVRLLAQVASPDLTGTERRKWARQAARSVLPECAETKVFVTANARAIRGMLEQRCSRHADAEFRRLACALYERMAVEAPNLFSDYRKEPLPDGSYELVTENRKV